MEEKRNGAWRGGLVDVLLVLGAGAISAGIGMIFLPAGVIAFGVLCLGGAYLTGGDGG